MQLYSIELRWQVLGRARRPPRTEIRVATVGNNLRSLLTIGLILLGA